MAKYRQRYQLRWLLILSSVMLLVGLLMPMLTIKQLMFIENKFSVVSGIIELWINGQYVLFIVIAGFSLVLPFIKLGLLYKLLSHDRPSESDKKLLHLMHDYGRWSMLDVMVVAMLIVSVKMGAIASIEIHIGLYIFGAAVLLIMLATQLTVRLLESDS